MDFTNTTSIDQWLRELPLGDVRVMTRTLYAAIRGLNNSQMVLRHHFDFLEKIGPSVEHCLAGLRKYYADVPFPLPQNARRAAIMADDLSQLLIHSYQLVLQQVTCADLGKSANDPRVAVWQTVAHRILYYSHRIQRNQLSLRLEERNALWQRIYRIYLASLQLPEKDRVIGFTEVRDYPASTLAGLVKRMLLLALIPLHTLRHEQTREVMTSMGYWASRLELPLCSAGADRKRSPFHFDPKLDVGPLHASSACDDCPSRKCILINCRELQDRITALLMRAARNGEDKVNLEANLANGPSLSISTLEILRNSWKERPKRIAQRDDSNEEVSVIFTIPAIHRALEEHGKAKNAPLTPAPKPRFKAASIREMSTQSLEAMFSASMNDAVDAKPSADNALDPLAAIGVEATHASDPSVVRHAALIRDHSQTGYRMEIPSPAQLRIRVGELAGIFRDDEASPQLGVVRWIREGSDHAVSFGILLIGHAPLVARFSNGGAMASKGEVPCLIAEHVRDDKTIMVTDHYPDIRDKRITLFFRDERIPIAFNGWPVEESRSFEAYEFGIRRGDAGTPDPNLPMLTRMWLEALTAKSEAEEQPTAKPATPVKASLDESVWRLN